MSDSLGNINIRGHRSNKFQLCGGEFYGYIVFLSHLTNGFDIRCLSDINIGGHRSNKVQLRGGKFCSHIVSVWLMVFNLEISKQLGIYVESCRVNCLPWACNSKMAMAVNCIRLFYEYWPYSRKVCNMAR